MRSRLKPGSPPFLCRARSHRKAWGTRLAHKKIKGELFFLTSGLSSWTYVRENRMDSPYLFLHPGFSIVASFAHTEEFFKKTKRSWTYMRENLVDSPYLFLHCVFS